MINRPLCALITNIFWGVPMVQQLEHYVVNLQVVGSNPVHGCVCGVGFSLVDNPRPYVPSTETKQLN